MTNWVRITDGSQHKGGFANLDAAWRVCVLPTIADPTKYAVGLWDHASGFETVLIGPPTGYASISDALDGARDLLSRSTVIE